jgi:hypothetical protein
MTPMNLFIEKELRRVHHDLKKSIAKLGKLCDCKTLRFDGGNTPDYSQPVIQQLYLLRYLYAYVIEYYFIYRKILSERLLMPPLNVISLGCGSMLDAYGLYFAAKQAGLDPAMDIRYTGVDIFEWQYQQALFPECYFLQEDLQAMSKFDKDTYNIVLFPKSIGEFSAATLKAIHKAVKRTKFKAKNLCIVSSARTERLPQDSARLVALVNLFCKDHGYTCQDDPSTYWRFPDKKGLAAYCPGVVYPNDLLVWLTKLLEQCESYSHAGKTCESDCAYQLNKWPMLSSKYINYQICTLNRP